MRKLKVYLDISVISYLKQDDSPEKSIEDCYHIAAAVLADCGCIISWNFKHIVNIKTIQGVRAITNLEGYKQIDILNPSVLLEHSGEEE